MLCIFSILTSTSSLHSIRKIRKFTSKSRLFDSSYDNQKTLHEFLKSKANVANPPKRLETLLKLFEIKKVETCDPNDRRNLHPFFIPLANSGDDFGSKIGLLRWPTAPDKFPMPLVKANSVGMELMANDIDMYIRRVASEEDFKETSISKDIVKLANEGLPENSKPYQGGSAANFKFG
eukprot:CAMPEP_0171481682 /NCGR_PEP_ID=MMETSP0946-20130122/6935_1 /TAXON_ID=109269 /ORGANISM="Vaucheria litorea, Strain CCMP2940" /LENGTH=177 /DNA_ID=CAMNT_0012013389 /DNA_START=36 /DNA_END=565 /DNA_ORIENTATION=-